MLELLLVVVLAQQSAPKAIVPVQSPKHIECTVEAHPRVESSRVLACFDEDSEKEFKVTVSAGHPWAKYLDDTQVGVSTVVIEGRRGQACLMQVHIQGDLVRNPVNEQINACVPVGRQRSKR